MKPLPHDYEVDLSGAPTGYATLSATGLPDLTTAPPAEYDGPGDAWSPEHLLLGAVSACFLFTFRASARAAHVAFVDVTVHTSGTAAKVAGVVRFTDIALRATVMIPAGGDVERLQQAVDKAAAHCLVSASLTTRVRVDADVRVVGSTAEPDRLQRTA